MEQQIQIRCKNNKKFLNISIGSNLSEIFSLLGLEMDYGPTSARVNNKVEGMHYRVYKPKDIEFLDIRSSSGLRAYTRTLFFILSKAAHDLWPGCIVSPYLMVQCSDSRHYGDISDRVYRFSAMDLTAEERRTIHGNNERIRLEVIPRAVEFFMRVMKAL